MPGCGRYGWVQPTGYDWDSFLGRTVREISPSHQSRECRGSGRASEAPAERKRGDMMLWITLGAVYLAIGAVIGLVLEDRYSRRSSAGPRSLKDYVRSDIRQQAKCRGTQRSCFMPANTHSTCISGTPLECFAEREDREGVAAGARRHMLRFSTWPSRT